MDTQTILEIFRQALKGGGDRLGQQFSPFSEEERQANMTQQPNFPGYNTLAGADAGGIAAQFAPQQVGTQRVGTQRDWSNNPHTRTDWGPELPMNGRQISAEEFGVDPTFAQRQYPGREGNDVVDRVLMEEQMRRRNRTMPGSPVNY
jgi:hypothetical protein